MKRGRKANKRKMSRLDALSAITLRYAWNIFIAKERGTALVQHFLVIEVVVQRTHQHSMRSTLKNLFCFAILKGYFFSGCLFMNTAKSPRDGKRCGILPVFFASRK